MSDTSKIFLTKVTDEVVIEILKALIPALNEAGIEYFIVGAFARDIDLLAAGHTDVPSRKTKDLDLAVMMASEEDFEKMRKLVADLEDFEPHTNPELPYKFLFKNSYEIDFIPFGEIANEKGEVELKAHKTFVLNIPGFDEVAPTVKTISTHEADILKTASLPGIVFLKLLAWQDRPSREKDIQDIVYILKNFMSLNFEEISTEEDNLWDLYEDEVRLFDEMVSARFIGRRINEMLVDSPDLRKRILDLLATESADAAKSRIARLVDAEYLEDSTRLIQQLYLGMMD